MKRHINTKHPYVFYKETVTADNDEDAGDLTDAEVFLDEYIDRAKKSLKARRSAVNKGLNPDEENGGEDTGVTEIIIEGEDDDSLDNTEEIGVLSEEDPKFEEKIKILCQRPVIGKSKAKNPIWNFFDAIEENHVYECLTCKKRIAIFPSSIGNLKRHIQRTHKNQYKIMMKYVFGEKKVPVSFKQYYFDVVEDGQYKCKTCRDVIVCPDDDQEILFYHFKKNHLEQFISYQESDEEDYSIVIVKNKDIL